MLTMNRRYNLTNPNQTLVKKVLTVCSAGLLRSPTLANVLHKEYGYNTRSAGANKEYALVIADEALLTWADEIVCVESEVFGLLCTEENLPILADKRVLVLDVPDMYQWGDPELERIALKQYDDADVMEVAYA